MATIAITPVAASDSGVDTVGAFTSATTGNTYTVVNENNPVVLDINNGTGGTLHATIASAAIPGIRGALSKVVAIPATSRRLVGPIDPDKYGESLQITVDGALSITAVQLPLTQRKNPI